jgi:hypothetical protein
MGRVTLRRRRKGADALLTAKLDKAWSLLIRSRGYCERCGRSDGKLDACHIIGRQNFRLRWEPRNGMCLCFRCHGWWHDHPLESGPWITNHRTLDVVWLESVQNESGKFSPMEKRAMLADLLVPSAESEGMEDAA